MAAPATTVHEAYYLYLGNYPSGEPGWHENVQGLAHDRDNWFITQTSDLWKIPVTHDLRSVSPSDPGVRRIRLGDIPQLANARYDHFGDPECYEFEGQGYVIVPIEETDHRFSCNGVAAFKADNLEYLTHSCLPGQTGNAGWVAVDPVGSLYSSNGDYRPDSNDTKLRKYVVFWRDLKDSRQLNLVYADPVTLLTEEGNSLTRQ